MIPSDFVNRWNQFYNFQFPSLSNHCQSCGTIGSSVIIPIEINYLTGYFRRIFRLRYCLDCLSTKLVERFNFLKNMKYNCRIDNSQTEHHYPSHNITLIKDETMVDYSDLDLVEIQTVRITSYFPRLPLSAENEKIFSYFISSSREVGLPFLPPELISIIHQYYENSIDETQKYINSLHAIDFNYFIEEVIINRRVETL